MWASALSYITCHVYTDPTVFMSVVQSIDSRENLQQAKHTTNYISTVHCSRHCYTCQS